MTDDIGLVLPEWLFQALWKHLLPRRQRNEEAAFCFARPLDGEPGVHEVLDWRRIVPKEFEIQSRYHLSLRDEIRGEVIKRAHDLEASIVEFHSHVFGGVPEFSGSDIQGFEETVPHCLWRLKERPYFAVVVSKGGFDGLAWFTRGGKAAQVEWIRSAGVQLKASGRTIAKI